MLHHWQILRTLKDGMNACGNPCCRGVCGDSAVHVVSGPHRHRLLQRPHACSRAQGAKMLGFRGSPHHIHAGTSIRTCGHVSVHVVSVVRWIPMHSTVLAASPSQGLQRRLAADAGHILRLNRCSWLRTSRCLLAPVQCHCWQSGHEQTARVRCSLGQGRWCVETYKSSGECMCVTHDESGSRNGTKCHSVEHCSCSWLVGSTCAVHSLAWITRE